MSIHNAPSSRSRSFFILGLSVAALGLSACGSDSSDSSDAAAVDGTDAPNTQSDAADITIANFDFGDPVTLAAGGTVTVTNTDSVGHTWTADDGAFRTEILDTDASFSFEFADPGEYTFFCEVHPTMTGSVTVTG